MHGRKNIKLHTFIRTYMCSVLGTVSQGMCVVICESSKKKL